MTSSPRIIICIMTIVLKWPSDRVWNEPVGFAFTASAISVFQRLTTRFEKNVASVCVTSLLFNNHAIVSPHRVGFNFKELRVVDTINFINNSELHSKESVFLPKI